MNILNDLFPKLMEHRFIVTLCILSRSKYCPKVYSNKNSPPFSHVYVCIFCLTLNFVKWNHAINPVNFFLYSLCFQDLFMIYLCYREQLYYNHFPYCMAFFCNKIPLFIYSMYYSFAFILFLLFIFHYKWTFLHTYLDKHVLLGYIYVGVDLLKTRYVCIFNLSR